MAEYKWSASVDYFGRLSTQHLHRETQRPDDADPVSVIPCKMCVNPVKSNVSDTPCRDAYIVDGYETDHHLFLFRESDWTANISLYNSYVFAPYLDSGETHGSNKDDDDGDGFFAMDWRYGLALWPSQILHNMVVWTHDGSDDFIVDEGQITYLGEAMDVASTDYDEVNYWDFNDGGNEYTGRGIQFPTPEFLSFRSFSSNKLESLSANANFGPVNFMDGSCDKGHPFDGESSVSYRNIGIMNPDYQTQTLTVKQEMVPIGFPLNAKREAAYTGDGTYHSGLGNVDLPFKNDINHPNWRDYYRWVELYNSDSEAPSQQELLHDALENATGVYQEYRDMTSQAVPVGNSAHWEGQHTSWMDYYTNVYWHKDGDVEPGLGKDWVELLKGTAGRQIFSRWDRDHLLDPHPEEIEENSKKLLRTGINTRETASFTHNIVERNVPLRITHGLHVTKKMGQSGYELYRAEVMEVRCVKIHPWGNFVTGTRYPYDPIVARIHPDTGLSNGAEGGQFIEATSEHPIYNEGSRLDTPTADYAGKIPQLGDTYVHSASAVDYSGGGDTRPRMMGEFEIDIKLDYRPKLSAYTGGELSDINPITEPDGETVAMLGMQVDPQRPESPEGLPIDVWWLDPDSIDRLEVPAEDESDLEVLSPDGSNRFNSKFVTAQGLPFTPTGSDEVIGSGPLLGSTQIDPSAGSFYGPDPDFSVDGLPDDGMWIRDRGEVFTDGSVAITWRNRATDFQPLCSNSLRQLTTPNGAFGEEGQMVETGLGIFATTGKANCTICVCPSVPD